MDAKEGIMDGRLQILNARLKMQDS